MNVLTTEMNHFFNVTNDKYEINLLVNSQLSSMDKETLKEAISRFELRPVDEYLIRKTSQQSKTGNEEDVNLDGFARYIDAYLVELSGGKRSELIRIGTKIMGRTPKAYSTRLMRLEILDYLLNSHGSFF